MTQESRNPTDATKEHLISVSTLLQTSNMGSSQFLPAEVDDKQLV